MSARFPRGDDQSPATQGRHLIVLNEDNLVELDTTIVRRLLDVMAEADEARAAADKVLGATPNSSMASVAPSEGARRSDCTWTRTA
jgi:hypothetical protein